MLNVLVGALYVVCALQMLLRALQVLLTLLHDRVDSWLLSNGDGRSETASGPVGSIHYFDVAIVYLGVDLKHLGRGDLVVAFHVVQEGGVEVSEVRRAAVDVLTVRDASGERELRLRVLWGVAQHDGSCASGCSAVSILIYRLDGLTL